MRLTPDVNVSDYTDPEEINVRGEGRKWERFGIRRYKNVSSIVADKLDRFVAGKTLSATSDVCGLIWQHLLVASLGPLSFQETTYWAEMFLALKHTLAYSGVDSEEENV
jgi:hypothetical protein